MKERQLLSRLLFGFRSHLVSVIIKVLSPKGSNIHVMFIFHANIDLRDHRSNLAQAPSEKSRVFEGGVSGYC